jgi:hypothetical protein
MFIILKQFIVGSDVAWVAKLNENDSIFQYETLVEAEEKLNELNNNETNGRKYRISQTN